MRSPVLGFSLLGGTGLVVGALIGLQLQPAPQPTERFYAATPTDQPVTIPAPAPTAPPVVRTIPADLPRTARPAAARLVKAKAPPRPAAKAARKAAGAQVASRDPVPAQAQWEQERRDYEHARADYDANERKEGFRWAQANNIRFQRYCRAAAQRTPAFMQGCLSYLRPVRANAPDKPTDGRASDEG